MPNRRRRSVADCGRTIAAPSGRMSCLRAVAVLEAARGDDALEELAGAGVFGGGEDPLRRTLLQDAALVEEAHPVGDVAREAHLVGRYEHGHALVGELLDDD